MEVLPLQNEKNEESNQVVNLPPMEKFICILYGFEFSTEKYLTDHFWSCKHVENPADTNTIEFVDCRVEFQSHEVLDNHEIKCETVELKEVAPSLFEYPPKEIMNTFLQDASVKQESPDIYEDLASTKSYICSLCGFGFTKEHLLANHATLYKDIENPADRLGVDTTIVKNDHSEEEIAQETEVPEEHIKTEPIFHINIEMDLDFTETNDSDSSCAQSGQTIEPPSTETPVQLFQSGERQQAGEHAAQLAEHAKVHKAEEFTRHIRQNAGKKLFKCTSCDYSTAHCGHLTVHMRSHTGEKPFKCSTCDYAGVRRNDLISHMRKHTGEKPFKCSICDYAGTRRNHLTVHMRSHTGDKPFKCCTCDYASVRRNDLMTHMRTHSGEKPFKCSICNKSFVRSDHLSLHRKTEAHRRCQLNK